tara:strand:+ start:3592 stop:4323 length:732 start_codon:yes stop_codon:yes gene_type:complete
MAELQASSFKRVSVTLSDGTSFGGVRAATTGTSNGSITTSFNAAVQIIKDAGRGAGTFRVRRGFLAFDTSGITGTVSSATLSLTVSHASADLPKMAIVRGEADGSSTGHFDSITGFNNSATMSGNVTDLIDGTNATNFSGVSTNTTVTITLNSTARGIITSEDDLYIVLVSYEYDYLLVEPSGNGFFDVGLYGTSVGTTSYRPHIDYVEVVSGYSHDVNGIDSDDIGEINTIASANVELFNGV